jgi:hypothetical protein
MGITHFQGSFSLLKEYYQIYEAGIHRMKLSDLIPDADVLCALEPEELGLRMLPVLAAWPHQGNPLQLDRFLPSVTGDARSRDYLGEYPHVKWTPDLGPPIKV